MRSGLDRVTVLPREAILLNPTALRSGPQLANAQTEVWETLSVARHSNVANLSSYHSAQSNHLTDIGSLPRQVRHERRVPHNAQVGLFARATFTTFDGPRFCSCSAHAARHISTSSCRISHKSSRQSRCVFVELSRTTRRHGTSKNTISFRTVSGSRL
jgi:hypothetical protein